MTPPARLQAAIEILDEILKWREHPEKILVRWSRKNRYAGSKDRQSLRDHIYDILRNLRSCSYLGGSETGRGLVLGLIRSKDMNPEHFFTGEGFAPPKLSKEEKLLLEQLPTRNSPDMQDWIWSIIKEDFGQEASKIAASLKKRAPIFLRVNLSKTTLKKVIGKLSDEGIKVKMHDTVPTALRVVEMEKQITLSNCLKEGLIELQDASSQLSVCLINPKINGPFLDLCSGGGGKSLALAAWLSKKIVASDIDPIRMSDIKTRARRAGAKIECRNLKQVAKKKFGVVFCDVPCSGSGSWRRHPWGKWILKKQGLENLEKKQQHILNYASRLVIPGGLLIYVTCSILKRENKSQIDNFLSKNQQWSQKLEKLILPSNLGDGFYISHLVKDINDEPIGKSFRE